MQALLLQHRPSGLSSSINSLCALLPSANWVPGLLMQTWCPGDFIPLDITTNSHPCHPEASWGKDYTSSIYMLSQPTCYRIGAQPTFVERMHGWMNEP